MISNETSLQNPESKETRARLSPPWHHRWQQATLAILAPHSNHKAGVLLGITNNKTWLGEIAVSVASLPPPAPVFLRGRFPLPRETAPGVKQGFLGPVPRNSPSVLTLCLPACPFPGHGWAVGARGS